MTNKSIYITIFIILLAGLAGSINIVYQYLNSPLENQQHNVTELNQKLKAAENQIRIIVNENNALRTEVSSLRIKIEALSNKLGGIGNLNSLNNLGNETARPNDSNTNKNNNRDNNRKIIINNT